VLGGGPVGYKASIEAASRGQYVALLDAKGQVSGLPTGAHSKCLREAAVDGAKTWADVDEVLKRAFSSKREDAVKDLKTYNVDELTGFGTVLDAERVRFAPKNGDEPREIHFDTLLIATGSKANRFPPLAPFFDKLDGLFDSDTIGNIDYLPKRVVVQGAGIIGLEYAQIFRKMGSQVTIVEFADKAVQMLDVSLQEACLDTMKQIGVPIHFKTVIKTVVEAEGHTAASPSLLVEIVDGETLPCDCLLSATGRSGCATGLGLENLEPLGLKIGRGRMIQAGDDGATGVPNVFAAGDVAGANLATVGMAQATRFVRSVFGSGHKHKSKVHKPYGVWTIPEIAAVGLNEQDAQKDYPNLGVAKAEYKQTVRGCVTNDHGFLKIIYNRDDGVVLGVHIIGENACDIINYGAEVVNDEDTIFDMLQFVFPAVTFHQLYHFAATDAVRRLKGARNLAADAAWKRLQVCIKKSIGVESTADALAEAFQSAFEHFDLDKSGFIKPNELQTAMDNMGLNSSPEEVRAMLEEVTGDPTITYVDYDQFMTHMMKQIG
jgi:NAD(P) transhydrogenase